MLAATQSCTLLDDVFGEDPSTNDLETYIAEMTGKEAALFVISGTMGNQLSIRTALGGPPHSVVADARSHVIGWYCCSPQLLHDPLTIETLHACYIVQADFLMRISREAGALASLSGAMPIPISPSNNHHLTLSDIQSHITTSPDTHYAPTRLIALENTLNGTILPLSDCRSISTWARALPEPIWLHLDGARLWEAVAAGAGTLKEYCGAFDSVTMCFSKGLGAPVSSIIIGSKTFITKARHLRKMMGGGLRQAGVITASARAAVDETFLSGNLTATHFRAREIARMWESKGGKLTQKCETNMVWLDLEDAGLTGEKLVEAGVREGVRLLGGRVVVHYQICEEAVERFGRVMDAILPSQPRKNAPLTDGDRLEAEKVRAPEMG